MRYEVEDAGGGCCLGPEVVVLRAEDGRAVVRTIPPRRGRQRRDLALGHVLRACDRLGVGAADSMLVCRSDLFDPTVEALAARGLAVGRGAVSEETHRLAEGEHLRRLTAILGFRPRIRDRQYAALNMMLRAEVERRPPLRRHWKANVRPPDAWRVGPRGTAGRRGAGGGEGGAPTSESPGAGRSAEACAPAGLGPRGPRVARCRADGEAVH